MGNQNIYTITFSKFSQGAHTRHKEMIKQLLGLGWTVYWIGFSEEDVTSHLSNSELKRFNFIRAKFERVSKLPFLGKVVFSFLNKILFNFSVKSEISHHIYLNNYLALGGVLATFKKVFFFCRMDIYVQYVNKSEEKGLRKSTFFLVFLKTIQYLTLLVSKRYVVQTEPLREEIKLRFKTDFSVDVLPNNAFKRKEINKKKITRLNLIGFIANMYWEMKGLDILSIYGRELLLPNMNLIVAGDGPDFNKIQDSLCHENVEYLGRVDAISFLLGIDVLLVTTRFDYCPNVLLEAMSVGVPIIASNIPVHKFLLGEDHPGLFDLHNIETINIKMAALSGNRDLFLDFQNNQIKKFYFDWGSEIHKILKLE